MATRLLCTLLLSIIAFGAVTATASASDWLTEINRYREATGLPDVVDQPAWDLGLEHHMTYLANTPSSYMTGGYESWHTENPASPYYTSDGATEAQSSDLAGAAPTSVEAIDGWLAAPFHAIGMLRARLTQVALVNDPTTGHAGLDVIQGIDWNQPAATTPILFPGPGITTNLLSFGGENPDPTETCGWQHEQVGLPLIAMLTQAPDPSLTATLSGPGGVASTSSGALCLVDANTYHSSDSVYGPNGASILQGDNAVLLIPHTALSNGTYNVDIQQPGQPDITWSFTAEIPVPVDLTAPIISGSPTVSDTLSAQSGQWSQSPTTYDEQWLRCDQSGNNCVPIPNANANVYRLTTSDAGTTIRVQETAANLGGPGEAASSGPTSIVAIAPSSGRPVDGSGANQNSCSSCLSARRPVILSVPRTVRAGSRIRIQFGGWRPFNVALSALTRASGKVLFSYRGHLRAGLWNFAPRLPSWVTRVRGSVRIRSRFSLGGRTITLSAVVRFV